MSKGKTSTKSLVIHALKAALADPGFMEEIGRLHAGRAAAKTERAATLFGNVLALAEEVSSSPKGRRRLPEEPDLTELDAAILECARAYASSTGRSATVGAMGKRFTNQGGPFVRQAAEALSVEPEKIVARIRRFQRLDSLRAIWDARRIPAKIRYAAFLKSAGLS